MTILSFGKLTATLGWCQPAGAVALILKASIAQLVQTVEKDGTRQGVLRFAFVEPRLHPPTQFRVLKPLQGEQGPFQPTQLPQGERQTLTENDHKSQTQVRPIKTYTLRNLHQNRPP
jgi:hypothetical protein